MGTTLGPADCPTGATHVLSLVISLLYYAPMKDFWRTLPKPFFILAPMDDVTDTVFRRIIAHCSSPDVFFTEFVSADGLQSVGREGVIHKLQYTDSETPLIAQIWGLRPENYYKTSKELTEMGFAGIDINMGCPVPKVTKMGACSALINNRELATEIIQATQEGASNKIPVSVKARIGFNEIDLSWIEFLLSHALDLLTIHGRTSKEQSKVPNHWEVFSRILSARDAISPQTPIVGNGDVKDRSEGLEIAQKHTLDGIMIGRGIFHDPYAFAQSSPWPDKTETEKIALYRKQIELFMETWGERKNPAALKKFAKIYINGFDGASALRTRLMECSSATELLRSLQIR